MLKLNLDKNKKYILACSYGPDSMALLNLLIRDNYNFVVCFVNYKTRKESDIEENKITKFCNTFLIRLYKKVYDLSNKISNFENEARKIRYEFFVEVAKKENIKNILIAHHLDDLIETYYLQKQSKRVNEYIGLVDERLFVDDIFLNRPLLKYEKSELLQYCLENNIDYSIDLTNFENIHKRNILRNEFLKNIARSDKENIFKLCHNKNAFLNSLYKTIDEKEQFLFVDTLKNLDIDDKNRAIFHYLKKNQITPTTRLTNEILNLSINDVIEINKKIIGFCNTFYIVLDKKNLRHYILDVKMAALLFGFDFDIFSKRFPNYSKEEIMITNMINFNTIKINDYIKSTKDYLREIHLPKLLRNIWPCIIDKDKKLIYFPRYQEKYELKHDIFNIDIIKFLTTIVKILSN